MSHRRCCLACEQALQQVLENEGWALVVDIVRMFQACLVLPLLFHLKQELSHPIPSISLSLCQRL